MCIICQIYLVTLVTFEKPRTMHNWIFKLFRKRQGEGGRKCHICQTWNWSRYRKKVSPLLQNTDTVRHRVQWKVVGDGLTYLPVLYLMHSRSRDSHTLPFRIRPLRFDRETRTHNMCRRVAWIIRRLMRDLLRLSGAYRCPLQRQRWTSSSFPLLSRLRYSVSSHRANRWNLTFPLV